MFYYFIGILLTSFRIVLIKFFTINFNLKISELLLAESAFYLIILIPSLFKERKNIQNITKPNLLILILIGILGLIDYSAFYTSIKNLPILYFFTIKSIAMPIFVFSVSRILFSEKLKTNNKISFLISAVGILILIIDKLQVNDSDFQKDRLFYIFLSLIAIFSYAMNINLIKKVSNFSVNTLLFIKFLPIFLINAIFQKNLNFLNKKTILYLFFLTIIDAISRYLTYFPYRKIHSLDLEIIRYTGIISSALFAFLLLGEIPTVYQIFGSIFIIGGNIASIFFRKRLDK